MNIYLAVIKCKKGDKEYLLDDGAPLQVVLADSEKDAVSKVTLLLSAAIHQEQRDADEEHKEFSYEVIVRPF